MGWKEEIIIVVTRIMSRKRDQTKPRPLAPQCNSPAAPSTVAADNRMDRRLEAGTSGGVESLQTQLGGGWRVERYSGHWEWQVTLARLFLALACVVLFNYALFERERKNAPAFSSCTSPSPFPFASALKHVTVVMLTQHGTRDHF